MYLSTNEIDRLRDAYGSDFINRLNDARRDLQEAIRAVDDAMEKAVLMAEPLNKAAA